MPLQCDLRPLGIRFARPHWYVRAVQHTSPSGFNGEILMVRGRRSSFKHICECTGYTCPTRPSDPWVFLLQVFPHGTRLAWARDQALELYEQPTEYSAKSAGRRDGIACARLTSASRCASCRRSTGRSSYSASYARYTLPTQVSSICGTIPRLCDYRTTHISQPQRPRMHASTDHQETNAPSSTSTIHAAPPPLPTSPRAHTTTCTLLGSRSAAIRHHKAPLTVQ